MKKKAKRSSIVRQKRRNHFKARMKERYGLSIKKQDLKDIKHIIRNNKYEYLKNMSLSKTAFLIEYKEKIIYIVYSNTSKTFLTALPLSNFFDMFRRREVNREMG